MRFQRYERAEFLAERWDYRPGQHVSIIAPTQNGKTTFLWQLLAHTDTSWCRRPPVMLVAKPRDEVVAAGLENAGYREIREWPPRWRPGGRPAGYGLWPRHLRGVPPAVNRAHLAERFRPALRELFEQGESITVADEIYYLCAVLGLSEEMTEHWTQGGGMGAGLWSATQKPSGTQQGTIPSFMYNQPTHVFLGRDNDDRNRKRFSEIGFGGEVSRRDVENAVLSLQKYEWLYFHRDGPTYAIVGA